MALEPITRQEKIIAGQDLTPITRMEKFLKEFGGGGGSGGAQSDWNQTDSSAADFIKNKPFGDEEKVIFPLGELEFVYSEGESASIAELNDVTVNGGDEVTVVWDGTTYKHKATYMQGMTFWGNGVVVGLEDNGEPFFCMVVDGLMSIFDITVTEDVTRNIGISVCAKKKIDSAYLPQVGTKIYVSGLEGPYLYLDNECTTAVTTNDILAIIAAGPFVVSYADAYFFYPTSVSQDVGGMLIMCTCDGDVLKYHTAEYTG